MTAKTTAIENISSDFSWLPSVFVRLGEIIDGFGPGLALAGAVWLFFLKRKSDREDEARTERRRVYFRYLDKVKAVANSLARREVLTTDYLVAVEEMLSMQSELALLAPWEVRDSAADLADFFKQTHDFIFDHNSENQKGLHPTDDVQKELERFMTGMAAARYTVTKKMRSDILKNTKVDR